MLNMAYLVAEVTSTTFGSQVIEMKRHRTAPSHSRPLHTPGPLINFTTHSWTVTHYSRSDTKHRPTKGGVAASKKIYALNGRRSLRRTNRRPYLVLCPLWILSHRCCSRPGGTSSPKPLPTGRQAQTHFLCSPQRK